MSNEGKEAVENEAFEGINDEKSTAVAPSSDEQKDCSRFSEDGMETEIEVSSQDVDNEVPKKKKKKKKKKNAEKKAEGEKVEDEKPAGVSEKAEAQNSDVEQSQDLESPNNDLKKNKKKSLKSKMGSLGSAPLLLFLAVLICVILPIAIYACDVIISVNVLGDNSNELLGDLESDDRWCAVYENFIDLNYRHNFTETVMDKIENIAKQCQREKEYVLESQIQREKEAADYRRRFITQADNNNSTNTTAQTTSAPYNNNTQTNLNQTQLNTTQATSTKNTTTTLLNVTSINSTTVNTTTTTTTTITTKTTTATTNPTIAATEAITNSTINSTSEQSPLSTATEETTSDYDVTTELSTTLEYTTMGDAITTTESPYKYRKRGMQCYNDLYFIKIHQQWSSKYNLDWHASVFGTLSQVQQALFFMFTVIGFIFLMISIVMRCEIFLNKKWSSFLIFVFLLYSISTSLTAYAFVMQTGNQGLRCFLCQFVSSCEDIDPWYIGMKGYFPTESVNWTLVAFLSFIFKLFDCFAFGFITLYFVLDWNSDAFWLIFLKLFGWLLVFPLMIFTPSAGVIAFEVLPATGFGGTSVSLALTILFGIGCAFWGICLIALPIFCRLRMCGNDGDETDDEEEEY